MRLAAELARAAVRLAAGGLLDMACWTLWLVLALVLVLQVKVAGTSEFAVPGFLLERLEGPLRERGLRVTFTTASFDPTGRILLREPQVYVGAHQEPVLAARAAYVRLSRWLLAAGRIDVREVRVSGGTLAVPAMLSGTGRSEPVLTDLEAVLRPSEKELSLLHASARAGSLAVTARGTLPWPKTPRPAGWEATRWMERFPELCRQALAAEGQLAVLQEPRLDLVLTPDAAGQALLSARLTADRLSLTNPLPVTAAEVAVALQLRLGTGDPVVEPAILSCASVRVGGATEASLQGVRASVTSTWEAGRPAISFVQLQVAALAAAGAQADAVAVELRPATWPQVSAEGSLRLLGAPLAFQGVVHVSQQTADLRLTGAVSPRVLDLVSARTKVTVQRFFDFDQLDCLDARVRLDPGWAFARAEAEVRLETVRAYGVTFDHGQASLTVDPRGASAPRAFARIGSNHAHGSYEHRFGTHDYRFLLEGQLRPMDISPWFGAWWPGFFQQLEFPDRPPAASVEVSGRWRNGPRTFVFVRADAVRPVIRDVPFDHVRTRLLIRPGYFQGLDLFGTRGSGAARGTFTYRLNPSTREWSRLDLAAESSLELDSVRRLIGPVAQDIFAPFTFAGSPDAVFEGRFDGPGSPGGRHHDVRVQASTTGEFRFFHFPLRDVSFQARVVDDRIDVDEVRARFANGTTTGKARVWGRGDERRVGFDFQLQDALLGEAAAGLADFLSRQRGKPPVPPGRFVQEKAGVRVELAASAEGRFNDLLSYRGDGHAVLEGAELGELPLLGGLSELLKFTALRFTSARANFRLDGPRIVFPEVAIRGANSAIDARGDYLLDRHELAFTAKIFPFQESNSLLKSVVGAVLSPLSNVFEVKLSGSLEKPNWALTLGPTSLLRALAGENRSEPAPTPGPAATPPPPPPPAAPAPPP